MARQTVMLRADAYRQDGSEKLWVFSSNRPLIDDALTPANNPDRYIQRVGLGSNGRVVLALQENDTGQRGHGFDLSDEFETNGAVRLATSLGVVTIDTDGGDTSEVYVWTPSNSADVIALYNSLPTTMGGTVGVLTLSDEPLLPTAKYNGNEISAWKYNGVDIAAAKYNGVVLL